MKKLMIAASAALCAAVGLADIESNNIVGYNQTALQAGKFLIGAAQFEDVESGKIDIQKVVSGLEGVDWDSANAFLKTAPQIQIQRAGGGYNTYYYLNDAAIADSGDYVKGWADVEGYYVDVVISAGTAFWLRVVNGDADSIVSGAVCGEDSVEVNIPQNTFTLVANAFPIPMALNGDGVSCSGIAGVNWDAKNEYLKTATQIQIQNAKGGYDVYYYLLDGSYTAPDGTEAFKPGWCDVEGYIADAKVEVGRGFWVKGVGSAFAMSFKK